MGDDGGRCATKKIYRESKYHVNRLHGMADQKTLVMVQEKKKVVTILFCVNTMNLFQNIFIQGWRSCVETCSVELGHRCMCFSKVTPNFYI